MKDTLHIISGDSAAGSLRKFGVPGDVLAWCDVLYEGRRKPGWPDDATLDARAQRLSETTGGALTRDQVRGTLQRQYDRLAGAGDCGSIVLWFDACLFDQSMLAHILTCLDHQGIREADLLCVSAFPGIEPFNGLGELQPGQLAGIYDQRRPVTEDQFRFAERVDRAFAQQDREAFAQLAAEAHAPLPWVPPAVARWLQEQPDPQTGLGRLEQLALQAIEGGCRTPVEIFKAVAEADTNPQYWGDTTLWAKINGLAERNPPRVRIEGPAPHLPQWEAGPEINRFRVEPMPGSAV